MTLINTFLMLHERWKDGKVCLVAPFSREINGIVKYIFLGESMNFDEFCLIFPVASSVYYILRCIKRGEDIKMDIKSHP